MTEKNWILKIEDAYRSLEMQKALAADDNVFRAIFEKCRWELDGKEPPRELFFKRLKVLIACDPSCGSHMAGAAVDISVINRDNGEEVWRGKPYLDFSEQTPMESPFVDSSSLRNRLEITDFFAKQGFAAFPNEFWHYSKNDSESRCILEQNRPAIYGPVHLEPETGEIVPFEDRFSRFLTDEVIESKLSVLIQKERDSAFDNSVQRRST